MQQIISSYQEAPSNIAIVKYWGKKGIQEPINPSLSFTLKKAFTKVNITYEVSDIELTLDFLFEGKQKDSFIPKLETFIQNIQHLLPYLKSGKILIESENTFPHSSGIASSASSMAAIAKALADINLKLGNTFINKDASVSEIARLGSGSACRSTKNGWVLWGQTSLLEESSNLYGTEINKMVHPNFDQLQDSILVIRKSTKSVSSSMGHSLMNNHYYQKGRIKQANDNIAKLLTALNDGDFNTFSEVCEEEALSLHGLMMSSSPGYTLMAPESVAAINKLKQFREENAIPLTYTLDAGPNIHILYQKQYSEIIKPFIENQLAPLCEEQMVIFDELSIQSN